MSEYPPSPEIIPANSTEAAQKLFVLAYHTLYESCSHPSDFAKVAPAVESIVKTWSEIERRPLAQGLHVYSTSQEEG